MVELCKEEFDKVLGDKPNQLERTRDEVSVTADQLLDVASTPGGATAGGLRAAVDVGVRYIASWLGGNGAAAIHNLMEDAATAEISRSQVWQWVQAGRFTADEVRAEAERVDAGAQAKQLFLELALADELLDFLTVPAYDRLED